MKNVLLVCVLFTLSINQSIYTKQLTLNINAEDWESDVSQYTYLILEKKIRILSLYCAEEIIISLINT